MTKLVVPITVRSVDGAAACAARAAEQGADLVEYRIDGFAGRAVELTGLVACSPLPCIVTCRSSAEGGAFDGDDNTLLTLLESACAAAPAYLDVELARYQRSVALRQGAHRLVDHPGQVKPTGTGLILSAHDFTGRPVDLYQRIEAMVAAAACRVVKVVWQARSLRDNLEAFEILQHRQKPTIALCMGEEGLPSRILARKFGALATFAALDDGAGTAPGQPTVRQLKDLYGWDRIDADTQVYGVVGHPVAHSMSPALHNAGFAEAGVNAVYLLLPIPPAYECFKATMGSWLDCAPLNFRGASVTLPHKENLLRFVQEWRGRSGAPGRIEPLAQRIGAANTLGVRDDGSLYASNTDYAAALDSVCEALGLERRALSGLRVAVIGAGGAARAIVAGFAHYGATVVIYNRTLERAQALAQAFHAPESHPGAAAPAPAAPAKVVAAPLDRLCDSCCQVFINCTPVGMHPKVGDTPLPAGSAPPWAPGAVVFDTIYNPVNTRFLREARAAGCLTIPGVEMFVRQGAAQFELWTGRPAPRDLLRRILLDRLGGAG